MRRTGIRWPGAVAVASWASTSLAAASCSPEAGAEADWDGVVRDSAGIAIVENRAPDAVGRAGWVVSDRLVLGESEGYPPETRFGHVADVAVDRFGRVYVLDQTAREVRIFSAAGRFEGTVGGPGEGPGELSRFASSIVIVEDTAFVSDWAQARVSRFHVTEGYLDEFPFPGRPGARSWWARGPDGSVYFRTLKRWVDDRERWRGTDVLFRLRPDRSAGDTLVRFVYDESDLGGPGLARVPLLVNAPSWASLAGGRVAWTSMERPEVLVHGPDGRLERIIRRAGWSLTPVDEAVHEVLVRLLAEKFEMLGSSAELIARLDILESEALPAITALRSGPDGTLWVQRMGDAASIHPMAINAPDHPDWFGGRMWDVFDGTGRYAGTIELPGRLRALRITGDAVYGVVRDELDVERVVKLTLSRRSPGP